MIYRYSGPRKVQPTELFFVIIEIWRFVNTPAPLDPEHFLVKSVETIHLVWTRLHFDSNDICLKDQADIFIFYNMKKLIPID